MSLSPALDPEPTMADLIESGRNFYATKKYKRALVLFTKAIRSCPCARGVERDRCTCKDFKMVAAQGGSIFREAMYTCRCDVGRTFSKCENVYHIQALDFRAATFEALGKLDHAMKDAECILELAPRLPDGYLRVGKIAQLKKHDEYAWKMYKAGIEALKEGSVDSSPKSQQLYDAQKPLNRRFFRQDPISLPAELVTHIFSFLHLSETLLCLRVCKKWKDTLTSPLQSPLWRNMVLPKTNRYQLSRMDILKKMLSWAGDGGARKIVIPDTLTLTEAELTLLLNASPSLEHLEIWKHRGLSLSSIENIWKRLRHVNISGCLDWFAQTEEDNTVHTGRLLQTFLQNAASSLEHLILAIIPPQWRNSVPQIPLFPKLKTLKMGYRIRDDLGASFSMFPLAVASPRLEQLCIGPDVPSLGPEHGPIWREKGQDMWPHLKVLVLHASSPEGEHAITVSTLQFLRCLNRGNSLQYIRFEFSAHELLGGLPNLFGNDLDHKFDVSQYAEFRNLRSLRSERMWISPDGAQPLLSNAINNEQLTSFDIVFPERDLRSVTTLDSSARHLKGYDWFRGTPSIHTLGCYGFSFSPHPKNDDDRLQNLLLPQFLATFPNLRTLHIDSSNYGQDAFAEVILSIMKVTRLKTIYMRLPESEALEKLRKTARFKGIQILWNDYSRQWPVSLES